MGVAPHRQYEAVWFGLPVKELSLVIVSVRLATYIPTG